VEFGNARYQDTIDRFIAGQPVADADLRAAWRNTTQSPRQTWDAPVYEQFYRTVHAVNRARPAGRQIRVLLGDPPIDWAAVTDGSGIGAFLAQRTAHAASVVEQQVLAKGHRALLCYGAAHLVHPGLSLRMPRGGSAGVGPGRQGPRSPVPPPPPRLDLAVIRSALQGWAGPGTIGCRYRIAYYARPRAQDTAAPEPRTAATCALPRISASYRT
jgi:hypothetical protein